MIYTLLYFNHSLDRSDFTIFDSLGAVGSWEVANASNSLLEDVVGSIPADKLNYIVPSDYSVIVAHNSSWEASLFIEDLSLIYERDDFIAYEILGD